MRLRNHPERRYVSATCGHFLSRCMFLQILPRAWPPCLQTLATSTATSQSYAVTYLPYLLFRCLTDTVFLLVYLNLNPFFWHCVFACLSKPEPYARASPPCRRTLASSTPTSQSYSLKSVLPRRCTRRYGITWPRASRQYRAACLAPSRGCVQGLMRSRWRNSRVSFASLSGHVRLYRCVQGSTVSRPQGCSPDLIHSRWHNNRVGSVSWAVMWGSTEPLRAVWCRVLGAFTGILTRQDAQLVAQQQGELASLGSSHSARCV